MYFAVYMLSNEERRILTECMRDNKSCSTAAATGPNIVHGRDELETGRGVVRRLPRDPSYSTTWGVDLLVLGAPPSDSSKHYGLYDAYSSRTG